MSLTLRIDSCQITESGTVIIAYTFGQAPLPVQPSGEARQFSSIDDIAQLGQRLQDNALESMFNLASTIALQSDPTLATVSGKAITLDPTNPAALVTYG